MCSFAAVGGKVAESVLPTESKRRQRLGSKAAKVHRIEDPVGAGRRSDGLIFVSHDRVTGFNPCATQQTGVKSLLCPRPPCGLFRQLFHPVRQNFPLGQKRDSFGRSVSVVSAGAVGVLPGDKTHIVPRFAQCVVASRPEKLPLQA